MKSKLFLTGLAIVALTMAGCQQDELVDSPALKGNTSIKASMEGVTTRSAVADNGTFSWVAGDQISVYTSKGTFKTFETTGEGSGNVTFTGNLESGETLAETGYAVYPAGSHTYSSSTLTVNLPTTYDYTNAYTPNTNAIMVAEMNSDNLEFKHVGGVLRFTISNLPKDAAQFVFTANTPITGKFTVTTDETDAYIATPATDDAASYGKTVTIKFPAVTADPSSEESMTFYVPLPTGTYNGFTVSIQKADNTELGKLTATAINVLNRADLGQFKVFDCATDMKIAASMEEVTSAFSNPTTADNEAPEVSVTIPSTVSNSSEATITLDEKFTAATNITPSKAIIAYEAAPTSVTINEETTSSATPGESKGEVRVVIPATAETSSKPNITINTPNLTAGLYADDSSVGTHYGEVSATTATNTLIIGTKVTVEKVTVNGGNVRVSAGAKLTAIEKGSNNGSTVYVYYEEGATLPENQSIEGIIFVKGEENYEDLINVAKNGGSYTLEEDITLSSPLVVEAAEVTIDLNGHSIKAAAEGLTKVLNTQDAVILVRRGAQLTINDTQNKGSIQYGSSETIYAAVKVTDTNDESGDHALDAAKLIVNGGTLKGYYYGISGNGTRHGTEITINGGTIKGVTGTGIYHPQDGTLNITNGEITGVATGIEVRSGELNITGGTITSTAETFEAEANGNGTTISGSAIAISQHTTDKNLEVTISNGTFNGIYALYETDLQNETGSKTMSISGGTFNGKIYSENCTNFVSGGTFSDGSVLPYVTENGNVTIQLPEDVTLEEAMNIQQGTVTIDLNTHTLTAASNAYVEGTTVANKNVTIYVADGAKATIQNGKMGNSTNGLFYAVFAKGDAEVTLNGVDFSEMVTYAYNGAGKKLDADNCTFRGWLSGWGNGTATFDGCTFTIGKAYVPAIICYGNTDFTSCKFVDVHNDVDTVTTVEPSDDGYYRFDYIVTACEPANAINFTSCTFINEKGTETGNVTTSDHPFHRCSIGDGTHPADVTVNVDDSAVTTVCSGYNAQNAQ